MLTNVAPMPSGNVQPSQENAGTPVSDNNSVKITIAGCGGCGMNLARPFVPSPNAQVLYFDTSMANSRFGDQVNVLCNSSGSGSNRAENARDIERSIPQLSDEEVGHGHVAVVIFSLAGGSGSVIGPLMIREYARRGIRVVGVIVADNSSSVGAKNTLNTLKTLTSICKNNNLYLPLILLSNDDAGRNNVDEASAVSINDLIDLLTQPVYEIDRNDRLNFLNPTAIVNAQPGLKLLSFVSDNSQRVAGTKALLGTGSTEMVDTLLILQEVGYEPQLSLPPARLKKTGFYNDAHRLIVGKVTSDVTSVDTIINYVEKMENQDRAQRHATINRLSSDYDDDLVL